jgi:predicted peptidase
MLPILCAAVVALPQEPIPAEKFEGKVTKTVRYNYLVSLPEGYEKSRARVPLILFLHGAGERGEDVQKVAVHGLFKEIRNGRKIPAVVIAPQCPRNGWWDADDLTAILDSAERKYRIDRDRIYVTGLSMGGYGTWALGMRNPGRFAALAPVCGGGDPALAKNIAKVPIWVTHGDADPTVPLEQSRKMVDATRAAGNDRVRFDVIKGGKHDTWSEFYANDYFYSWLFAQRRGK